MIETHQELTQLQTQYQQVMTSFGQLPQQDQEALDKKIVKAELTLEEWLEKLNTWLKFESLRPNPNAIIYSKTRERMDNLKGGAGLIGAVLILSLIGIFQNIESEERTNYLLIWGACTAIIALLFLPFFLKANKGLALSENVDRLKRQTSKLPTIPTQTLEAFLLPLLSCFKEEIPSKRKVFLQWNLQDKLGDEFSIEPENAEIDWNYYLFPWISIKVKLRDNAWLLFKSTYFVRRRVYSKKSASGKWKHKSKTKARIRYELLMKFSRDYYTLKEEGRRLAGVKIKSGDKNILIKVKSQLKIPDLEAQPNLFDVLGLVQKAYAHIKPI